LLFSIHVALNISFDVLKEFTGTVFDCLDCAKMIVLNDRLIFLNVDWWRSNIKASFGENSLNAAWMFNRISIKNGFS
jgi:hypothetical protein